ASPWWLTSVGHASVDGLETPGCGFVLPSLERARRVPRIEKRSESFDLAPLAAHGPAGAVTHPHTCAVPRHRSAQRRGEGGRGGLASGGVAWYHSGVTCAFAPPFSPVRSPWPPYRALSRAC